LWPWAGTPKGFSSGSNDELELDLLSENGFIQEEWLLGNHDNGEENVHCIPFQQECASLLPQIDLLQYDMDELEQHQQYIAEESTTTCTFYNYPPSMSPSNNEKRVRAVFTPDALSPSKRRKVSEDGEYIPSVQDLKLPFVTPEEKSDEVSKYLQERLEELLQKFQSSYASVMESKKKLQAV